MSESEPSPRWTCRVSLALAAALLSGACVRLAGLRDSAGVARRPNVVLIVADDLGYGDIGVHGCPDFATPSIDRLAREGVRCTNAYASGPRCAPTRAGMFTGRYQQRFGCELTAEQGLPSTEVTLAERLQGEGYATGLIGKWHLGTQASAQPLARGFDEFFGFLGGASASLPASDGLVPDILRGREPALEREYLLDAFAREAVAFVERHASEPFFLTLAFNAPHSPVEAPRAYLERHASIADPTRRRYAAMVSAMDDAIGRVLDALHRRGLDESTLVVFLSDNGGPLDGRAWNGSSNAPLRGNKGETLEGGIRVPFLVRWTGALPAGSVYEHPVSSLDLFPTALAAAGVEPEAGRSLDGVSLLEHLAGRDPRAPHEALYWCLRTPPDDPDSHKWAVRRGNLKLVHVAERGRRGRLETAPFGLYDLSVDPGETADLRAKLPETAREMEELWLSWVAGFPAQPGEPDAGLGP